MGVLPTKLLGIRILRSSHKKNNFLVKFLVSTINVDSLSLTELKKDSMKCTQAKTDNPVIYLFYYTKGEHSLVSPLFWLSKNTLLKLQYAYANINSIFFSNIDTVCTYYSTPSDRRFSIFEKNMWHSGWGAKVDKSFSRRWCGASSVNTNLRALSIKRKCSTAAYRFH